ncbi:hypothetical protein EYF80_028776 [Liparis tanakae]|uniref:Uncharacterized protein n=1 Tax=Liparis tanakae TaxID=230148 RepID=A0A4Z2H558_9TELE|nr:hypothetical protein EYF80_028776 [Liparis tanakae]
MEVGGPGALHICSHVEDRQGSHFLRSRTNVGTELAHGGASVKQLIGSRNVREEPERNTGPSRKKRKFVFQLKAQREHISVAVCVSRRVNEGLSAAREHTAERSCYDPHLQIRQHELLTSPPEHQRKPSSPIRRHDRRPCRVPVLNPGGKGGLQQLKLVAQLTNVSPTDSRWTQLLCSDAEVVQPPEDDRSTGHHSCCQNISNNIQQT